MRRYIEEKKIKKARNQDDYNFYIIKKKRERRRISARRIYYPFKNKKRAKFERGCPRTIAILLLYTRVGRERPFSISPLISRVSL